MSIRMKKRMKQRLLGITIDQTLRGHLADIDLALRKIQEGGYGVCEKCKKEIPLEILEVDPESRLCKECKK